MVTSKECSSCVHWSEHPCVNDKGETIKRKILNGETIWTYELCKKNWGLPQHAHLSPSGCKFFKEVK